MIEETYADSDMLGQSAKALCDAKPQGVQVAMNKAGLFVRNTRDQGYWQDWEDWNPLENENHALLLSIYLDIDISYDIAKRETSATFRRGANRVTATEPWNDKRSAVMRAVTRAAAAIGRGGE